MDPEKFQEYYDLAVENTFFYLPRVALAIIILLIGIRLINRVVGALVRKLQKREIGGDVLPFLGGLLGVVLKVALFFVIAGTLGFDTAGLVTIIAAAGFAVGLALQGSLSNFAAGILLLIFKPYRRDDWIQVGDFFGKVKEVQIFNTILETPGSKTLIVPNSESVENVVTNFSRVGMVRLELHLLMAYEENFPRIREVITQAVRECSYVLPDPAPLIGIESYDTHNIVVAVRPYVDPETFWEATYEVNETIKTHLSRAGIRMAYSEGVELGKIGE